jgi:hypothetical protein
MKLIQVDIPIIIGQHELETSLDTDQALWLVKTGEQTTDGIRRYYYAGQPPRRILIVMRNGEPLERVEPGDMLVSLVGWDDGANPHVLPGDVGKRHTKISVDRVLRLAEADAGRVAEMLAGDGTPSVRLSEIAARAPRSDRAGGWRGDAAGRPVVAPGDPTEVHAVSLPASLWRAVEEAGAGNRSLGLRRRLVGEPVASQ